MMRIDVLGADGTFSGPGGACSGYLLRHDGYTLWMDAGNGTLGRLQEHVPIEDVDAVVVSHAHPDHCADLYPFFHGLWFHPARRRGVPVVSPPGVGDKLALLLSDTSREVFFEVFSWRAVVPGEATDLGPFRLTAFDSVHSARNNTARVECDGRVMCYSGDTGPNPDLARAAAGADLFLCEASWQQGDPAPAPIHLLASEAGSAASRAGVGRLALTHIWPLHDPDVTVAQASEHFDGPIDVAARTGSWIL